MHPANFWIQIYYFSLFFSAHLWISGSIVKTSYHSRRDIPICSSALRHSSKVHLQESYDVVVIGAGAAGCIVSAKLANDLSMTVLLVEAGVQTGNNDNDNITNPATWLHVLQNDTLEWHFQTVAQTALKDRVINLGFAKGTGGSAMHNAMGYVRGGQKW
jgi:NADPH-dependent 2,4-dienoyl-CoA reductase/sulfur reductase-like enzyme